VEYLNKALIERFDGSEWSVILSRMQIVFVAWFPRLPGCSEIADHDRFGEVR
jgi:hypothetical protein